MPFETGSVAGIFMIDVLHHIPQPALFLKEAERVLAKGGKILMTEPANSAWGRFIYRNFHHEPFEPKGGWEIPATGPLSGANGALPWIIFERDRQKFEAEFPHLKIESIRYHTPLRYLLSGGVSKRQLAPNVSYGLIKGIENALLALTQKRLKVRRKNSYYWDDITRYCNYFIHDDYSVIEVGCGNGEMLAQLKGSKKAGIDFSPAMLQNARNNNPGIDFYLMDAENITLDEKFDVVIISNVIGYLDDIQAVFEQLKKLCHRNTKVIVTYYSYLWEPFLKLAEAT
eukprot:gene48614-65203_t